MNINSEDMHFIVEFDSKLPMENILVINIRSEYEKRGRDGFVKPNE